MTNYYTPFRGGISSQGNTAGTTGTVLNQAVLVGGSNITLSQSVSGQQATVTIIGASGGGGIAAAAGTQTATSGTLAFLDSNGIAWGLSNSSQLTASYTQSTHAHTAFVLSDSNGLAWGTNVSTVTGSYTQSTHSHSSLSFANSNGVSWGTNGSTITATVRTDYQPAGAYLTTAMLSNQSSVFAGVGETVTTTAGTDLKMTVDTAGVQVAHPVWLTTAMASNRGTDFVQATAAFAGTNASGTIASNGISVSVAAPGAGGGFAAKGSGTYTQNTGTIEWANSNGITFGLSTNQMTASHNGLTSQSNQALSGSNGSFNFQTATFGALNGLTFYTSNGSMVASHNGLTTARASNDGIGLNTAQTNVTWTVNSGGLSFNAAGYAGTGTSATNATLTLNSNGLQISVANPGGGAGNTGSVFHFLPGPIGATTGITSLGKSSCMVQPVYIPNAMSVSYVRVPVSISLLNSGSATTAARSWTLQQTDTYWVNFFSQGVGASSRSLQYVAGSAATLTMAQNYHIGAASNNQTHSFAMTFPYEGLVSNYADNNNVNSASFTFHTTNRSSIFGYRWLDIPFASSLSAGNWWVQVQRSSATASTSAGGNWAPMTNLASNMQLVCASQVNVSVEPLGFASNANTNVGWQYGLGMWTTNTNGATTASMSLAHISGVANRPLMPIILVRQA